MEGGVRRGIVPESGDRGAQIFATPTGATTGREAQAKLLEQCSRELKARKKKMESQSAMCKLMEGFSLGLGANERRTGDLSKELEEFDLKIEEINVVFKWANK
jgi:hypothetical protein